MPAPLTITNTDRTSEDLLEFALNCKDHRQRRRVRAIAFRLDGMSPGDVAAKLGTTVQSVRDWTIRYNRAGLDGLADDPRTGRPGRLDAGQRTLLGERVKAGPGPEDGGLVRWRLKDLVAWATARFGVSVSLAAMHRTLHALGFSHQTVRPVHPKADPERQRDFEREIVCLGRTRRKDDVVRCTGQKRRDLILGVLDGAGSRNSCQMIRMRVSKLVAQPRRHGIGDLGCEW